MSQRRHTTILVDFVGACFTFKATTRHRVYCRDVIHVVLAIKCYPKIPLVGYLIVQIVGDEEVRDTRLIIF